VFRGLGLGFRARVRVRVRVRVMPVMPSIPEAKPYKRHRHQ